MCDKVFVEVKNCNNIENAMIEIEKNKLNIKYGMNGIGKSTISKAIETSIKKEKLEVLMPFKNREKAEETGNPLVRGLDTIDKILVFNEDFVNQFVFQRDEILNNSFKIFIETKEYKNKMHEISLLTKKVDDIFKNDEEIDELIKDCDEIISLFGNGNDKISGKSKAGKALKNPNTLSNIPAKCTEYKSYLESDNNVDWIDWQTNGKKYLEIESEQCPYCVSSILEKKELIEEVSKNYTKANITNLKQIIKIFDKFKIYFSDETNKTANEILNKSTELSDDQNQYLSKVKSDVETLRDKLKKIKSLNYFLLKDDKKSEKTLEDLKIKINLIEHLNSDGTKSKINPINEALEEIKSNFIELNKLVSSQTKHIKSTIKDNEKNINDFLGSAGYEYKVMLEETANQEYIMVLKHNQLDEKISDSKIHLSYGEKNAFALVLFMHTAISEETDLIILDDPISSFDKNKKYAILYKLFIEPNSLKNKTVLLFTHDFEPVIDAIYNFSSKLKATAHFLENKDGEIIEIKISKEDIMSFEPIAMKYIEESSETIIKMIFLRRLMEIRGEKGLIYELISSFLKLNITPQVKLNNIKNDMNEEDIRTTTLEVCKYISGFDYKCEMEKLQDVVYLNNLYKNSSNNYEKLQLFRTIKKDKTSDTIINKFINEIFHIENDYLFQLDPYKYNVLPNYIVKKCDEIISVNFSTV